MATVQDHENMVLHAFMYPERYSNLMCSRVDDTISRTAHCHFSGLFTPGPS